MAKKKKKSIEKGIKKKKMKKEKTREYSTSILQSSNEKWYSVFNLT